MRLLREAQEEMRFGVTIPWDAARADRFRRMHTELDNAVCFLLERDGTVVGLLFASAAEHFLTPIRVATEMLLFVTAEHRGNAAAPLLDAFEAWARENGCSVAEATSQTSAPRTAGVFAARGYQPAETHHVLIL